MLRRISLAALVAVGLGAWPTEAHGAGPDEVEITGRVFRGTVVEERPHVFVRIRLDDGTEVLVPWSEIVAMHRAAGEPVAPVVVAASKPQEEPELPRHWYGWQTLLVDAGSLVLFFSGVASGSGAVTAFSGVSYVVGPPVVHIAHGRGGIAIGSALLRLGAPFVFGLVGLEIGNASAPPSGNTVSVAPLVDGALGLVAGVLAAVAVDDAVFAWEPGKAPAPAAGVTLVPRLTLTGDAEHGHAGWMGVGGTF
jgi:hypothetical protein